MLGRGEEGRRIGRAVKRLTEHRGRINCLLGVEPDCDGLVHVPDSCPGFASALSLRRLQV